jgi:hypothetical protein
MFRPARPLNGSQIHPAYRSRPSRACASCASATKPSFEVRILKVMNGAAITAMRSRLASNTEAMVMGPSFTFLPTLPAGGKRPNLIICGRD